jgi:hypothetical protein
MTHRFRSWLQSIQISEIDVELAALKMHELPREQTRGFPFWFILKMVHPSAGGPEVRSKEKTAALLARWTHMQLSSATNADISRQPQNKTVKD